MSNIQRSVDYPLPSYGSFSSLKHLDPFFVRGGMAATRRYMGQWKAMC